VNDSWRRFADTANVERFQRVGVGDDYVAACRSAAERGDATAIRTLAGIQGCFTTKVAVLRWSTMTNRMAAGSATP
jgi:hypothetical protein